MLRKNLKQNRVLSKKISILEEELNSTNEQHNVYVDGDMTEVGNLQRKKSTDSQDLFES